MQPSCSERFRSISVVVVLVLGAACSNRGGAPQPFVGEFVARVNGAPIPTERLEELIQSEPKGSRESEPGETTREHRRRMLELLIDRELMYQQARALGLTIDADRLDERVSKARSQFATEAEFLDYLEKSGQKVEDIRSSAERRLLISRYADEVAGTTTVDEAEVRAAYESRIDEYMDPEMLHAMQIFIPVKRTGDAEVNNRNSRELAEQVRARVVAGESFSELAYQYSTGPNNPEGGDMGFFPRGRWFKEFDDVVFHAEVGELTPVFRTALGFHIVKILEFRPPQPKPFEEVKNSLIMVLTNERREEKLQQRLVAVRAEATIEILDPELDATR